MNGRTISHIQTLVLRFHKIENGNMIKIRRKIRKLCTNNNKHYYSLAHIHSIYTIFGLICLPRHEKLFLYDRYQCITFYFHFEQTELNQLLILSFANVKQSQHQR